jgi:hypothetical protein
MLEEQVYCPRCDDTTTWSNGDDGSLVTRCSGCGLARHSELTSEEHERALRKYERMSSIWDRPTKKTWRWV